MTTTEPVCERTRTQRSVTIAATRARPKPSRVYTTFWRFAVERHRAFQRRLNNYPMPWTTDPIILTYRFTNVFRAVDRVSQYLIRGVQHRPDLPSDATNLVFRTILFKLFNRIETWELLESRLPSLSVDHFEPQKAGAVLSSAAANGQRLYSAAYIMPSTGVLGERRKHLGHLKLIQLMTSPASIHRMSAASNLRELYEVLLAFPTLGPFLAFQFAIDLNYSGIYSHNEMEFVVAGPGAQDGIRKCFTSLGEYSEADTIRWVTEHQIEHSRQFEEGPPTLFGRPLQLIDVQNIFCEVSKYARVAHPEVAGTTSRRRIKQLYRPRTEPISLFLPPHWRINDAIPDQNCSQRLSPHAPLFRVAT